MSSQDWLDLPHADTPPAMPDGVDSSGRGILSGLPMPPDWSLANSSINYFVHPETMKTIHFAGNAPPETPPWLKSEDAAPGAQSQPSQPDGGGFYTGLTPYQPDPS